MFKDIHVWLPGYIIRKFRRRPRKHPLRILFAMVDHFEPRQKISDPPSMQIERVDEWISRFESRFSDHRDSTGRPPLHSYFFPQEQYREDLIEMLAEHCRKGFGEVEIHIHHDGDTTDGFINKISKFKSQLGAHGLLARDKSDGELKYGFVHGNWALDNSRKDGRWCGLNNEITLLRKTGCYADFTMPSAPADCQTRKINSIYFADDDPVRPKSHDSGIDVSFGGRAEGDLLLIQGPLALNWRREKLLPGIENGDINSVNPITGTRIKIWIDQHICVRGKEDVIFVKVHCHGLKPRDSGYITGEGLERGLSILEEEFNDGEKYILHYVTAREMANIVMAYNDGEDGPIRDLRDYRLEWPR